MTKKMNEEFALMPLLEDIKSGLKILSNNKIDYAKIDNLSTRMERSIATTAEQNERLNESIEAVRKPVVSERRFTINIISQSTIWLILGLAVVIVVLVTALYQLSIPNFTQQDNDLKYRYIKMKGEATPTMISELEDMFELNRDDGKIGDMRKAVEEFEQTVYQKVLLDEQTRRQYLESEQLNRRANELKLK
ncbi:MAG: hypothetical protein SNH01_04635 [Rikenellaceae bacterium]